MANIEDICTALEGRIRGKPVAVSLFAGEVPDTYEPVRVEPCGILRYATDEGRRVYTSAEVGDCLHGTYLLGLDGGSELMQTGRLLTDHMPMYTPAAAKAVNNGAFRMPTGTFSGFGAAPLDDVPEGIDIGWVVVVCTPKEAALIAAARSVKDGVMPNTAAGNSFCTDAFVTPWYTRNVVLTPGDYGGRMVNRLKPEELFVIVPIQYADNLIGILAASPDIAGIYEATRPPESSYWEKKAARERRIMQREQARQFGLTTSLDWDDDALAFVAKAPRFVRGFAVSRVEDFAADHGYDRVTLDVVNEQMDHAGSRDYMGTGDPAASGERAGTRDEKKSGLIGRLFRR
jgi:uncharacterized protein (DUF169 family)